MCESGVVRTIHGVSVAFPCRPYPSQMSMMEKIIKGIEKRENCLLESPTGSGKSLALLCAALAWQHAEYDKVEKESSEETKKACKCEKSTNNSSRTADIKTDTTDSELQVKDATNPDDGDFKPVASFRMPTTTPIPQAPVQQCPSLPFNGNHVVMFSTQTIVAQTTPTVTEEYHTGNSVSPDNQQTSVPAPSSCSSPTDPKQCCCYTAPKTKRKVPKIYFGTRTHKQITQIVRELKKTAYAHCRMTILASRDHTCIHSGVSKFSSKTEGCKELLDGPGCMFQSNVRKFAFQSNVQGYMDSAWDIEDMVKLCSSRKVKSCPYFTTRALRAEADIVFCPYNYLISPTIRKTMEISLKDQIVIFDEAHNIENCACEEMCRSVAQADLHKVIKELTDLVNNEIKPQEHSALNNICVNIDQFMTTTSASLQQRSFSESSRVWHGYDIIALLDDLTMGPKHFQYIQKCFIEVSSDEEGGRREGEKRPAPPKLSQAAVNLLDNLICVLDYMYRADLRFLHDFKVALLRSAEYGHAPDTSGNWLNSKRKGRKELRNVLRLKFWCFSPAVAFSDFECTRTVILTSGTLSPMQSFQSELGMDFKITLEANHVINDSQVWVGALGRGPHNELLQATYKNTEQLGFQDELGHAVINICQTVPRGVLCFLPSYKMLETLTTRWQTTGLWDELLRHKQIICEPRASDRVDFDELINTFYEVVNNDRDTKDPSDNGALFMAVCRGKVSEGLDFADNNARAVITIGIPYPSFKDIQVELKRQYNDQNIKKGLLSGSDWYEIQAFRALNQALGRCIRHRNDWGSLIMIDDRFVQRPQKYIKGLSKWVRNKACTFSDFTTALSSLSEFTLKHVKATPPINTTASDISLPNNSTVQSDVTALKPSISSSVIIVEDGITDSTESLITTPTDCSNMADTSCKGDNSVIVVESESNPVVTNDSSKENGSIMKEIARNVVNGLTEKKQLSNGFVNSNRLHPHFLSSSSFDTQRNDCDANKQPSCSTPGHRDPPQRYSTPNRKIPDSININDCSLPVNETAYMNGMDGTAGVRLGVDDMNITMSPIVTVASLQRARVKSERVERTTVEQMIDAENMYTMLMNQGNGHKVEGDPEYRPKSSDRIDEEIDSFQQENDAWLTSSPTLFDSQNDHETNESTVQLSQTSRAKPKLLFRNAPPKTFSDDNDETRQEVKINDNSATKKRKCRARDVGKSDASDGEFDSLNTKRKSTRGKTLSRCRKKPKGVIFIDSDDDEERNDGCDKIAKKTVVSCQKCKASLLTSTSGLLKKRSMPGFLKSLWLSRPDLYVASNDVVLNSALQPITSSVSGLELNSQWLPEHSCCVQYLHCIKCDSMSGGGEKNSSGHEMTTVAVRVVHSSDDNTALTGQIWILGSVVDVQKP